MLLLSHAKNQKSSMHCWFWKISFWGHSWLLLPKTLKLNYSKKLFKFTVRLHANVTGQWENRRNLDMLHTFQICDFCIPLSIYCVKTVVYIWWPTIILTPVMINKKDHRKKLQATKSSDTQKFALSYTGHPSTINIMLEVENILIYDEFFADNVDTLKEGIE